MDAVDYLSDAITGSQVRLHAAAGEAGLDRMHFDLAVIGGLNRDAIPPDWVARGDFLMRLFEDFYEVTLSLECLANIPIYLRRFSYRDLGISKAAHLRYHYENWLNEVYILEVRFKTFATRLERAYRKSALASDVSAAAGAAASAITRDLRVVREARGAHVHQTRFVDREILLLDSSELIVAHEPSAPFDPDAEFRRVRKLKAAEIQSLNLKVREATSAATQPLADCLVVVEGRNVWLRTPFSV